MTYAEERREIEAARRAGEEYIRGIVTGKLREIRLENDAIEGRSATERAYRKGWNESLGELERWLEARAITTKET